MSTTPGGGDRLGTPSRPLRVVVVGSSVGMYVRPPRRSPHEGTYADLLEPLLHDAGVETVVVNRSRWLLTVPEVHRRSQELILDHRPDVVVLDVGFVESQPRLTPLWVVRWLFTWRPRLGPVSRAARVLLLGPLWWLYVHGSPLLLRAMPWLPSRVRPATMRRAIESIARLTSKERAALTLLVDVPAVTERVGKTLPGIDRRIEATNATLRAVAAADGLTLVPAATLVARLGHEVALPDGIHFSARGHEQVAQLLVGEITRWLETVDGRLVAPGQAAAPPGTA